MHMTVGMEILKPVVALAAWTMVMWVWMYATRIPAMSAAKLDPDSLARDPSKTLDDLLPASVQWKAHNYNHLHEAPTVFYAVAIVLAMIGQGDGVNAMIAWAYVGLRVVHSLVQATVNKVMVRFMVFSLSSLALIALVLHAALAIF
ncbi:MAPEG family protein [Novosphingobium cyanobacteriorum]|uniref:MAPEG family protein n=1 Tax=Novosphingobium cyanobacteriorum TaxID=3024215 RepID=A0ABT6CJ27_9SPHN|nr:MAPEG family protein [Novosphingobium cyanobacteriorum]MDF8333924.1 MAPEG family protein [Novosphingobium cyanobacteriorum]